MSPNFQTSLSKLERLSPTKLDKTSRRIRGAMADAEWKMGLCLLALKRSGAFRKLGFGTLSAYAERVLQLSGRKVGALLGAAEALEHLPLMSEAFRAGRVCWSKVRVMHGLATPETEGEWLEFARVHTSVEVERKVALSPLEWKRHRALKASLAGKPSVSSEEVTELLSTPAVACGVSGDECSGRSDSRGSRVDGGEPTACSEEATRAEGQHLGSASGQLVDVARLERQETPLEDPTKTEATERSTEASSESIRADARPAPPSPPRTIRLVFELTPDQYALYEQAESRVRAQEGRRLPRAEVLRRMAESVLSEGTAKSRARHQVLVHTIDGSDDAWYETERGVLPVGSEVLREALGGHEVLLMDAEGRVETAPETPISERAGAPAIAESGSGRASEFEPAGKDKAWPGNVRGGLVDGNLDLQGRPDHGNDSTEEPVESKARPMDVRKGPVDVNLDSKGRPDHGNDSTEAPVESKARPMDVRNGPVDGNLDSKGRPDHESDLIESVIDPSSDLPELTGACLPQTHTSDRRSKRTAIPNATIRQVFARAGHRCECCGRKGGRLDVHHLDPVSEGGGNDPRCLELLCRACHTKNHEPDFEEKWYWRAARDAALARRLEGGVSADPAVVFKRPGEHGSLGRRR